MSRLFPWLILVWLFLSANDFLSQNDASKWYFGFRAGLDFMTNPPTILTNGSAYSSGGCSSISDLSGNLLFYTKSDTIWNRNHAVMANGTGLAGSRGIQASLIIKQPGN